MLNLRKTLFWLSLSAAALLPALSSADTFYLSDGTVLKGRIVIETSDSYVLKVEIAENILSEKTVKKSLIEKIVKDDKSLTAFNKIKEYFPLPDHLTVKDYRKFESKILQGFRDKYPKSKYIEEVNQISKDLQAEIDHLQSGGLKLSGKHVTRAEYEQNKYEYDALIKLRSLKLAIKKKQYTHAMQTFEQLEKGYSHTEAFRIAVPLVQRILPKYKASVTHLAAKVADEVARRDRALGSLSDDDKKRTTRLLEAEASQYERSLAAAKEELKTKWLPLNKFYDEPAKRVLSNITSEENRLKKLRYDITKDAGLYYREFLKAIELKDPKSAGKYYSKFRATRPSDKYLKVMKIALDQSEKMKLAEAARLREKKLADEAEKRRLEEEANKKAQEKPKKKKKDLEDKVKSKLNIDKHEKSRKAVEEEIQFR